MKGWGCDAGVEDGIKKQLGEVLDQSFMHNLDLYNMSCIAHSITDTQIKSYSPSGNDVLAQYDYDYVSKCFIRLVILKLSFLMITLEGS